MMCSTTTSSRMTSEVKSQFIWTSNRKKVDLEKKSTQNMQRTKQMVRRSKEVLVTGRSEGWGSGD